MDPSNQDQVTQWLRKLERESWQLELLVSAFTIFLLIGASSNFENYLTSLTYEYSFSNSVIALFLVFLNLLHLSINSLIVCLVIHLMLRGFWIGAIGLRSVQASIDFTKMNYGSYFTERLKKRVIGLDALIVRLDELCSVLFSISFLIISMIIAFGLWLIFFGFIAFLFVQFINATSGIFSTVAVILGAITMIALLLSGLMYLVDFLTLGFFKKKSFLNKVYYPFYRLYGIITISSISRSIYYYLISKYPKKRIRIVYAILLTLTLINAGIGFDQYQYFSDNDRSLYVDNNHYDDLRPVGEYIQSASIDQKFNHNDHLQLFIRYHPQDNPLIKRNCPDFEPLKKDGINQKMKLVTADGNLFLKSETFEEEDRQQLLSCLTSLYDISVDDSTYTNTDFYFFEHPGKSQKGLLAMLKTSHLKPGKHILHIKKSYQGDSTIITEEYANIPFWKE